MKKINLVIFDLDGTLIDSLPGITYCLNRVLKKNHLPEQSFEKVQMYIGNGIGKLVERAVPEPVCSDSLLIGNLIHEMKRVYKSYWKINTTVFKGISQMLDEIQRQKVLLAVISNKTDEFAKVIVRELFPEINFLQVIGAGSRFGKKPDPGAVQYILGKHKIAAAEAIFVGDSDIDVQTALNAGVNPIGVGWGYRSSELLKEAGCPIILQHPLELVSLLTN